MVEVKVQAVSKTMLQELVRRIDVNRDGSVDIEKLVDIGLLTGVIQLKRVSQRSDATHTGRRSNLTELLRRSA